MKNREEDQRELRDRLLDEWITKREEKLRNSMDGCPWNASGECRVNGGKCAEDDCAVVYFMKENPGG